MVTIEERIDESGRYRLLRTAVLRNCLQFNLRQLLLLCTLAALTASGQIWNFVSLGNAPIAFALSMILYDLLGSRRRAATRQPEAKPVFIDGAR